MSGGEMRKFKGLERFIAERVHLLPYEAFQPPVNKSELLDELKKAFHIETAFWDTCAMPESWVERWFSIEPKFFGNGNPVAIALSVVDSFGLRLVVYRGVHATQFEAKLLETDLSLESVWLDHGALNDLLVKVIGKVISFIHQGEPNNFEWE